MTMTEYRVQGTTICTYTGRYVNPLDLKVEDIDIEDIAHHLSNQCRFSGATAFQYSVAQHSVLVSDVLGGTSFEFEGLMHDAQEAYLQDMPRPLKEHPTFGAAYREAEDSAQAVIAEAFGFDLPLPPEVKDADNLLLAIERRDIMPPGPVWAITEGIELPDWIIAPISETHAEELFLERFTALSRERD